jgi:hypothetical protein
MGWLFDSSARDAVDLEESTAKACRDEARFQKAVGNDARAAVYDKAAAKAEERAGTWRGLFG